MFDPAGGKKQPYYVSLGEGKVLRMAGLYDVYTGERGVCVRGGKPIGICK